MVPTWETDGTGKHTAVWIIFIFNTFQCVFKIKLVKMDEQVFSKLNLNHMYKEFLKIPSSSESFFFNH